jgi:hypothetical protein
MGFLALLVQENLNIITRDPLFLQRFMFLVKKMFVQSMICARWRNARADALRARAVLGY